MENSPPPFLQKGSRYAPQGWLPTASGEHIQRTSTSCNLPLCFNNILFETDAVIGDHLNRSEHANISANWITTDRRIC